MPKAILFDLDGVLVHSREAWFPLVEAAARDLGRPPVSRAGFDARFGQGVDADIEAFFPGRTPEEVEAYYVAHFREHAAAMRVDPDAREVLQALSADAVPWAVVTNTPTALAREMLAAADLPAPLVVGAGRELRDKPAPDLVLRALARLGVDPSEAVLVGDSRYDRDAAAAAGVGFVGYGLPAERTVTRLTEVLALVR